MDSGWTRRLACKVDAKEMRASGSRLEKVETSDGLSSARRLKEKEESRLPCQRLSYGPITELTWRFQGSLYPVRLPDIEQTVQIERVGTIL